jgi:uncharacterized protein
MTLDYWFMLPVAILIATTAMASGVGGATFFTPIFILALRLPPEVAIGVGLITEVFGFASGLFAYARKRLIDYRLAKQLLLLTVPVALLGTGLATIISATVLKIILGLGLLAIALSFLCLPEPEAEGDAPDGGNRADANSQSGKTRLVTAAGEEIYYTACDKKEARLFSGIGALFLGIISTGLGEMNDYFLLQRCRLPSKVAIATSVMVVAITALVASIGHVISFAQQGSEVLDLVLSLVIFTIPGVVVGAQLGSAVASHIPKSMLVRGLGLLFIVVATLTLGEAILL